MNMQQLVARYEAGAKTGHEFVVDCLNLLGPGDPASILDQLPPETLPHLRKFLKIYRPGKMRSSHGDAIPTTTQYLAARKWLSGQKVTPVGGIRLQLLSWKAAKQMREKLMRMLKERVKRDAGSPKLTP